MPIDHEFGDQHTELKLSIVEKYLKFFTTALRGKFKELWYIDAFAGTGSRTVRHEERAAGLLDSGEPERIERRRITVSEEDRKTVALRCQEIALAEHLIVIPLLRTLWEQDAGRRCGNEPGLDVICGHGVDTAGIDNPLPG